MLFVICIGVVVVGLFNLHNHDILYDNTSHITVDLYLNEHSKSN